MTINPRFLLKSFSSEALIGWHPAFFGFSNRAPSTDWRLGVVAGGCALDICPAYLLVKAQNLDERRSLAIDLFVQDSVDCGLGDLKSLSQRDFAELGGGLDLYEHFVACLHGSIL
jgi:hypothetical protein